jgi:hypothetical protein
LIQSRPVGDEVLVQIPVSNGGALQLSAECFRTFIRHKVLHRLVDKPAAMAGFGQPVDGLDGSFGQNDVEALIHEIQALVLSSTCYTHSVWMSRLNTVTTINNQNSAPDIRI